MSLARDVVHGVELYQYDIFRMNGDLYQAFGLKSQTQGLRVARNSWKNKIGYFSPRLGLPDFEFLKLVSTFMYFISTQALLSWLWLRHLTHKINVSKGKILVIARISLTLPPQKKNHWNMFAGNIPELCRQSSKWEQMQWACWNKYLKQKLHSLWF